MLGRLLLAIGLLPVLLAGCVTLQEGGGDWRHRDDSTWSCQRSSWWADAFQPELFALLPESPQRPRAGETFTWWDGEHAHGYTVAGGPHPAPPYAGQPFTDAAMRSAVHRASWDPASVLAQGTHFHSDLVVTWALDRPDADILDELRTALRLATDLTDAEVDEMLDGRLVQDAPGLGAVQVMGTDGTSRGLPESARALSLLVPVERQRLWDLALEGTISAAPGKHALPLISSGDWSFLADGAGHSIDRPGDGLEVTIHASALGRVMYGVEAHDLSEAELKQHAAQVLAKYGGSLPTHYASETFVPAGGCVYDPDET